MSKRNCGKAEVGEKAPDNLLRECVKYLGKRTRVEYFIPPVGRQWRWGGGEDSRRAEGPGRDRKSDRQVSTISDLSVIISEIIVGKKNCWCSTTLIFCSND